jgi:hypothetical protein
MLTYSVTADNCNAPKIIYKVEGLSSRAAKFLAEHLSQAFRQVEVFAEETGEVAYALYYDSDFKKPSMSEVECLSIAQNILAD